MKNFKWENFFAPVIGFAIALLISVVLFIVMGINPGTAFVSLFKGSFGSVNAFSATLLKMCPLLLCGLAVVISYKTGIFNIGAESQLYFGAIGATIIATNPAFQGLPAPVLIIMAFALGALFGGILGFLPGVLKAYRGVNEVVITMLLNYIAAFVLTAFVQVGGFLHETGTLNNRSNKVWDGAILPNIPGLSKVHIGIIIAVLAAIVLWFIFKHTVSGFKMTSVGLNPKAAEYVGINNKMTLTNVMIISGAIAGLAGAIEILGYHFRLQQNFSIGIGYTAIAVALLANLNPIGVIFSALFFSALTTGASTMQSVTKMPSSFSTIIQGLIIFCVIASSIIPKFVSRRRNKKREREKVKTDG